MKKKSCKKGQEINPLTNRCKKIQLKKSCKKGQEINPLTNRCKKIQLKKSLKKVSKKKSSKKKSLKKVSKKKVSNNKVSLKKVSKKKVSKKKVSNNKVSNKKVSKKKSLKKVSKKKSLKKKSLKKVSKKKSLKKVSKKKSLKKVSSTPLKYKIRLIIPQENPIKFEKYVQQIQKLLIVCFKSDIKIDINNYIWVFAKHNEKIISCLCLDASNTIWNVCTDPLYRGQGVAKKLFKKIIKNRCKNDVYNIYLYVSKIEDVDNYKKRIDLYKKIGFKIYSDNDEEKTTMYYNCKKKIHLE